MHIEAMGDFLMVKDAQNELLHLLPKGIFVHQHPLAADSILLADISNGTSIKDAIEVNARRLSRVGDLVAKQPSRSLAMVYLSLLLDSSAAVFDNNLVVNGYSVVDANSDSVTLEGATLVEEQPHYFNRYGAAAVTFGIDDYPFESTTFRMTNATSIAMKLKDNSLVDTIVYGGAPASEQSIYAGQSVEVTYEEGTGLFTITDL